MRDAIPHGKTFLEGFAKSISINAICYVYKYI